MATQRRRSPTDHTGAQREKLEKEHAEEMERRAEELGMATQAAREISNEVTDYTGGAQPGEPEAVVVGDTVEIVEAGERSVEIRINTDLEEVTIGAGNTYNFKEGQRYKVPAHVAAHLEEKGFVWH